MRQSWIILCVLSEWQVVLLIYLIFAFISIDTFVMQTFSKAWDCLWMFIFHFVWRTNSHSDCISSLNWSVYKGPFKSPFVVPTLPHNIIFRPELGGALLSQIGLKALSVGMCLDWFKHNWHHLTCHRHNHQQHDLGKIICKIMVNCLQSSLKADAFCCLLMPAKFLPMLIVTRFEQVFTNFN